MAIKIQMPKLSDTMDTGRMLKWVKKEGEKVATGDVIAEVETDKANMDMEAYDEGILLKIVAKEGDRVPIGGLIAILGEAGEDVSGITGGIVKESEKQAAETKQVPSQEKPTPAPTAVTAPSSAKTESSKDNGRLKASPLAKNLARQRGIDIGSVKGSGTGELSGGMWKVLHLYNRNATWFLQESLKMNR